MFFLAEVITSISCGPYYDLCSKLWDPLCVAAQMHFRRSLRARALRETQLGTTLGLSGLAVEDLPGGDPKRVYHGYHPQKWLQYNMGHHENEHQ